MPIAINVGNVDDALYPVPYLFKKLVMRAVKLLLNRQKPLH